MRHWRFLLIRAPRMGIYRANWSIIIPRSFIVMTAAEAQGAPGTEAAPNRFIGEAEPLSSDALARIRGSSSTLCGGTENILI